MRKRTATAQATSWEGEKMSDNRKRSKILVFSKRITCSVPGGFLNTRLPPAGLASSLFEMSPVTVVRKI